MSRPAEIVLNVFIAVACTCAVALAGAPGWAWAATGSLVYYLRDAVAEMQKSAMRHPYAPAAWVIHKHAAWLAVAMVAATGVMGGLIVGLLVAT